MNRTERIGHRRIPPFHGGISHIFSSAVRGTVGFVKKNPVLSIAAALALITSVIVPPDSEYIGYFDFRTLTCLFCTLAVICALKEIRFFYVCAERIISLMKNLRLAAIALVYITFIGSMLIANDMALITFLPLGYLVLSCTGKERHMAYVFILQNIAANLGGMLTPFGNPQNLYLYTKFGIPNLEFMGIMLPPFLLSITLITICCLFVKSEEVRVTDEIVHFSPWRTGVYLALFLLSILIVFRGIPYQIGLVVIPVALAFLDRKALAEVDYPLLFTFVFFFVFAGNMARIDWVKDFFSGLMQANPLVYSAISCQLISNVPSAILLSQFTDSYRELLVGVNVGGAGTLIASLASLITFREYLKHNRGKALYYIAMFSVFNFGMLAVLLAFERFIIL